MPSVILVTAGYDHRIIFWAATTGLIYRDLKFMESQINTLAITPDKLYLAAGGNPNVRLFDIKGNQSDPVSSFEGHTNNVVTVGFHSQSKWMFSGSEDGTVKIWDLRVPGVQQEFKVDAGVTSVAVYPTQQQLMIGDDQGFIAQAELRQNKIIHRFEPIPRDTEKNSSEKETQKPTSPKMPWEKVVSQSSLTDLSQYDDWVEACKASASDLPSFDLGIQLQLESEKRGTSKDPLSLYSSHLLPQLQTEPLASPSSMSYDTNLPVNKLLELRRLRQEHSSGAAAVDAAPPRSIFSVGHRAVRSVDVARDGSFCVAGCSGGTVHVYDPVSWKVKRSPVDCHETYILKTLLSSDAETLATCSSDHTIKLWDVKKNFKLKKTFGIPASTKQDNRRKGITTKTDGHSRWVWDCVFSADSAYLISSSSDGTSLLWETASGKIIQRYAGHKKSVTCVALHDMER